MIEYVTSADAPAFRRELADMHRLRYRVFHERLGWDVAVHGDQERDTFDALPGTSYLLYHDAFGRLRGCARLLKTTGPTMLRDVFQELLAGAPAPSAPTIWESTRFAVDDGDGETVANTGTGRVTIALLAGMTEVALRHGITEVVSVCDVRVERVLRQTGLPVERIGAPVRIGRSITVAGRYRPTQEVLAALCLRGQLPASVLTNAARIERAA